MSGLKRGWILEERISGIDRWFRTNAWIYDSPGKALDLAERRVERDDIEEIRILEIDHTDPRTIQSVGGSE